MALQRVEFGMLGPKVVRLDEWRCKVDYLSLISKASEGLSAPTIGASRPIIRIMTSNEEFTTKSWPFTGRSSQ